MKIAEVLIRTLRELATMTVSAARVQVLTLVSVLAPALLSPVLAVPSSAQGTIPARPSWTPPPTGVRWLQATPMATSIQTWTGQKDQHVGLYLYRLVIEVQLMQYYEYRGKYRSYGFVRIAKFQRKELGKWKDVNPSNSTASGSFSGPRSPVSWLGSSGYSLPNPFSNFTMGSNNNNQLFVDVSGPGFAMTSGAYSVTTETPLGTAITASVAW